MEKRKSRNNYITGGQNKMNNIQELTEKLIYAKDAVQAILNKDGVMVDWHGIVYWAEAVERLRKEIKEQL
jgi:hypothetical protein